METVRNITGYATSKDYKTLVELMVKQSVIIIAPAIDGCQQQVARTIHVENHYAASTPGYCILHATTPDEFIKQCKDYDVGFLPPNRGIDGKSTHM